MKENIVDAAKLSVLLNELRLPASKVIWPQFAEQAETSVLFELISARYERRSTLITANQPFGAWEKIFPDPAMTLAAVNRLVHHATIFEMNVESYRRHEAVERRSGPGRPASYATPANIAPD